jgi:hypothetical protein
MEKHEKKEMIIIFLNLYIKKNLGMNDILGIGVSLNDNQLHLNIYRQL